MTCVVLNACYSDAQAASIVKHVDYVIGMSDAIGDDAAIAFAVGFYQSIFNGEDVPTSHKLGCAQIHITEKGQEHLPTLLESTKGG